MSENRTQKSDTLQAPVAPVPKPRMSQRDKWRTRPCVMRYRAFCDELRLQARRQSYAPADALRIRLGIPMPKSWSARRRGEMRGRPHQQRPDVDNMIKAVLDALLPEDASVYRVECEKRWADDGLVEITNITEE